MRTYLNWKTYLVLLAIVIAGISLYNANKMVAEMAVEEQKKVDIIVKAITAVAEETTTGSTASSTSGFTFATQVIDDNKTIPFIITDEEENIISYTNIDSVLIRRDSNVVHQKLQAYKAQHGTIVIDYKYGKQLLFYGDSHLLEQLRQYPLILLGIISVFVVILIVAISNAQRSIQNQVWVGMSKETAHQLGTPLSSIVAWLELLREHEPVREWVDEMEKDLERLQLIAERFSKIGSAPQLIEENLIPRLQNMVDYMQKRAPQRVNIQLAYNEDEVVVLLSGPLFDWVIENLIRNALDAMEGKGAININVENQQRLVIIDIADTGKGIPKNKFKKVFAPGYSTKQRGWGLGLSLAKRIINKYHNGSIFVKCSEPGKGTTFRIILRR
jgi:signal transduction histidine kinase